MIPVQRLAEEVVCLLEHEPEESAAMAQMFNVITRQMWANGYNEWDNPTYNSLDVMDEVLNILTYNFPYDRWRNASDDR